jgi:prevent-host-death family protein
MLHRRVTNTRGGKMLFANMRELKLKTSEVIERTGKEGPVMITKRGKPVAILRGIGEEDNLYTYGEVFSKMRKAAEKAGYKAKDVEKLIAQVRENR